MKGRNGKLEVTGMKKMKLQHRLVMPSTGFLPSKTCAHNTTPNSQDCPSPKNTRNYFFSSEQAPKLPKPHSCIFSLLLARDFFPS